MMWLAAMAKNQSTSGEEATTGSEKSN